MYVLASLLTNRRYLPARCRLYALAARACDDAGCPEAARAVLALLGDSTHALRAAEEMQQPLPPPIAAKLRAADEDLAILAVAADAAAYGDLLTPDLLTRGGGGLVGAPVGGSEEEEPQWACWTWGAGFEPTSAALWWNRRPADQERLGVGEIRQPFVYALPQRVLGVDAAQEPATQLKSRCRV